MKRERYSTEACGLRERRSPREPNHPLLACAYSLSARALQLPLRDVRHLEEDGRGRTGAGATRPPPCRYRTPFRSMGCILRRRAFDAFLIFSALRIAEGESDQNNGAQHRIVAAALRGTDCPICGRRACFPRRAAAGTRFNSPRAWSVRAIAGRFTRNPRDQSVLSHSGAMHGTEAEL